MTTGTGRGGRTLLREDAGALASAFSQVGADDARSEDGETMEEREVQLGPVEDAITKDLTRHFLGHRRCPIGKEDRDRIVGWHSKSPGSTMVPLLKRKGAIGTDESNTSATRLTIPLTKGVVFRNTVTDATWRPMDLEGQEPGCDGKLREQVPEVVAPALWPARLPNGIWIMPPDCEPMVMTSERRQSACEALMIYVLDFCDAEEFRSKQLMEIIGGSSPWSVVRAFTRLGWLHVVGGTPRSPKDPSRYVVVMRPYRNLDGELIVPQACDRWQELVSGDGPSVEQVEDAASTPRVKTKEEIAAEIARMAERKTAIHEDQRRAETAEVDATIDGLQARVPELQEAIRAMQEELAQLEDSLDQARGLRSQNLRDFQVTQTPELIELERQITLREQLLAAYELMFTSEG